MRNEQKVWQVTSDASASIYSLAERMMQELIKKHFAERRFYFPTQIASGLISKPLTVGLYSERNPYANPVGIAKLLSDMAATGYLDQVDNGGYTLSEKGKNAINTTNDAFYKQLNKVNQFPANKLNALNALLEKLVDACKKADLANGNLSLEISSNGNPTVEAGSLAQTDQLIDDLNAFRDDSHISAWTPTGKNGHTWETLSFVWNGEANTVEKLVERLPYRYYTADDFAKTLTDLTQRGLIEPSDDGYKATADGKKIREEAEEKTNEYHFSPWKTLTDDELTKLSELLNELNETNIKIAKENKAD